MPIAPKRVAYQWIACQWILGTIVGTAIIGMTSPLFVRSYLPLEVDTDRGVWTLPTNQTYRWRSEGYADTSVGPHGMPGRANLPTIVKGMPVLALWGDSQTEGVGVSDQNKLFAQLEDESVSQYTPITVLPLARSGENAADWLTQMPRVESKWSVDAHVFFIVDLDDLQLAIEAPLPAPTDAHKAQANAAIARRLPAFVIQAARFLLTEPDEVTRRKLRFALGKATNPNQGRKSPTAVATIDWQPPIDAIAKTTTRPVVIVYAPQIPSIVDGKLVTEDRQDANFDALLKVATAKGFTVIDTRDALRSSAASGRWPHGFHNGQFGVGHLNADGYQVIAQDIVKRIYQEVRKPG